MDTPVKKPVGRPRGYSPGLQRKITNHQGPWSWDTDKLNAKIRKQAAGCYEWTGSTGPYTNLFGVYKNGKPQMTQANRIIYMERTGEDITNAQIMMTCHNRYCCRFEHMTAVYKKEHND